MEEEIVIKNVESQNNGTLISVDILIPSTHTQHRIFVEIRDIFKALNNHLYKTHDEALIAMGFELEDPENYKNENLIE